MMMMVYFCVIYPVMMNEMNYGWNHHWTNSMKNWLMIFYVDVCDVMVIWNHVFGVEYFYILMKIYIGSMMNRMNYRNDDILMIFFQPNDDDFSLNALNEMVNDVVMIFSGMVILICPFLISSNFVNVRGLCRKIL